MELESRKRKKGGKERSEKGDGKREKNGDKNNGEEGENGTGSREKGEGERWKRIRPMIDETVNLLMRGHFWSYMIQNGLKITWILIKGIICDKPYHTYWKESVQNQSIKNVSRICLRITVVPWSDTYKALSSTSNWTPEIFEDFQYVTQILEPVYINMSGTLIGGSSGMGGGGGG